MIVPTFSCTHRDLGWRPPCSYWEHLPAVKARNLRLAFLRAHALECFQIAMPSTHAMLDLAVANALDRGKICLARQLPKARCEPRGINPVEPRHMLIHLRLADNGRPVDGI